MTTEATPAKVRLTEELGPLPESRRGCYDAAYSADQMRAYAEEQVAAERERVRSHVAAIKVPAWARRNGTLL